MSEKLLSIIVPSYNMEKYLHKCLSSLIIEPEKLDKLDVIVVNDGSTDRTSEIAHEFADKYPKVFRVIDKQNGHYGSCINAGLKIASGKFVRVVDADDFIDSNALMRLVDEIDNPNEYDAIITNFNRVNEEGVVLSRGTYKFPLDRCITPNEILEYCDTYIGNPALTFRLDILRQIKYVQTEKMPYTDMQWALFPIVKVLRIKFLPIYFYQYLIGREGQTVNANSMMANVDKQSIVSLSIYKYYCGLNERDMTNCDRYYKYVICKNIEWMYRLYILGYGGIFPKSSGKEFDLSLKAILPNVYDEVGNAYAYKFPKIRFIKIWRKSGCQRDAFVFRFFNVRSIVINALKKILGKKS